MGMLVQIMESLESPGEDPGPQEPLMFLEKGRSGRKGVFY